MASFKAGDDEHDFDLLVDYVGYEHEPNLNVGGSKLLFPKEYFALALLRDPDPHCVDLDFVDIHGEQAAEFLRHAKKVLPRPPSSHRPIPEPMATYLRINKIVLPD